MPKHLIEQLNAHVGPELREKITRGCETLASATPLRKAEWWKGAMERLDALVDEPTRVLVMENCGRLCAWKGPAEVVRKARKSSKSMDEFFGILQSTYPKHVPLERDGFTIYADYTRCYCGRVSKTREPISPTHCQCSKGYYLAMWESALGKPVLVDLVESIISGGERCRFAIHVPEDEFGRRDGSASDTPPTAPAGSDRRPASL